MFRFGNRSIYSGEHSRNDVDIILLPMTVSGVLSRVSRWLLAVRCRIYHPGLIICPGPIICGLSLVVRGPTLFVLGRQLNGVGVVKTGDHNVAVFSYSVVRFNVVVIKWVRCDSHLVVVAFIYRLT